MAGFNRGAYKGASLTKMKDERKNAEKRSFGNSGRAGFHKIEEGKNIFRIMPAHSPEDTPFRPCRTTWLKCLTDTYEDGEPTGNKEVKNKRIFIATEHGIDVNGNAMTMDPIETYVKYVYQKANDEIGSKDERESYLANITGYMKDKKFHPGIRPSTNFVYYALKDGELGRIEMYPMLVKEMEKLSIASSEESDVDIFSDPDEGVSLIIDYNPKGAKGEKYAVSKAELNLKGLKKDEVADAFEQFTKDQMVSDKDLEEFSKKESLKKLYGDPAREMNAYWMKDFDFAIDGLERFDQENGFDIFENEEFQAELLEIKKLVQPNPKKGDGETEEAAKEEPKVEVKKPVTKKVTPKVETTTPAELADDGADAVDTSKWSKMKCRAFLNDYIEENYEVIPTFLDSFSLSDLRMWAAAGSMGDDLPVSDYTEGSSDETTDEPVVESQHEVDQGSSSTESRLEAIGNRRKK